MQTLTHLLDKYGDLLAVIILMALGLMIKF